VLAGLVKKDELVEVWVTNDTLKDFQGRVVLKLQTLKGEVLSATEEKIIVPPNSSRMVLSQELDLPVEGAADRFVAALLYEGGELVSQNILFLKRFKHLELPEPAFNVKIEEAETGEKTFRITISSPVFAKAVHLRLPSDLGRCSYSDNYFDILPDIEKTVVLITEKEVSLEELKDLLEVSWL